MYKVPKIWCAMNGWTDKWNIAVEITQIWRWKQNI